MTTKEKLERMLISMMDFVGAPDLPEVRYHMLVLLQATYLTPGRMVHPGSIDQLDTINEALLEVKQRHK